MSLFHYKYRLFKHSVPVLTIGETGPKEALKRRARGCRAALSAAMMSTLVMVKANKFVGSYLWSHSIAKMTIIKYVIGFKLKKCPLIIWVMPLLPKPDYIHHSHHHYLHGIEYVLIYLHVSGSQSSITELSFRNSSHVPGIEHTGYLNV